MITRGEKLSVVKVLVIALTFCLPGVVQAASTQLPAMNLLLSDTNKVRLIKRFEGEATSIESLLINAVEFDGYLWFKGNDTEYGEELWRTDGTPSGTVRVTDIYTGQYSSTPLKLTVLGDALYFFANDPLHGTELRKLSWDSGLNKYETELVKDISPGAGNGVVPAEVRPVVFRDRLFFAADDGVSGSELWMSNGTQAGTMRIIDINAGADDSSPQFLTVLDTTISDPMSTAGEVLVFAAEGPEGKELYRVEYFSLHLFPWVVTQVADIRMGVNGSDPEPLFGRSFSICNGELFFSADDGTHGEEPWKSNGFSSGTTLVKDIRVGNGNGVGGTTFGVTEFENALYFSASETGDSVDMWRTDGTEAGTYKAFSVAGTPHMYAVFIGFSHGGSLYFSIMEQKTVDDPNVTSFWRLYRDGTSSTLTAENIGDLLIIPTDWAYYQHTQLLYGNSFYFNGHIPGEPDVTRLYKVNEKGQLIFIDGQKSYESHSQIGSSGLVAYKSKTYFFVFDRDYKMSLYRAK